MRIVKYLTISILLCAVLILAETTRLLYTVNFAFGSMRAYYEVQITQEDLPAISELSKQYGIPICIVENKMASVQEFDIYSTVDESTLVDTLQIQSGTFRSVFYKNPVQISIHTLTDFEVPEKTVRLYYIGNQRGDFEKALSSLVTIQGGIMFQQNSSSMLVVIPIAWGILIVFAFFLSAFDAESKRRTCFVRIMNGASPLQILLCNIGIELLVMTGIISFVAAVTSCFVTVQIGKQNLLFYGLLMIASMLPYLKLTGTSCKIITQERLSISRLLNFGYIYKTLLLCMTMAVFSLTASLGADFIENLRVLRCVKDYEDYSLIKIETTEVSLLGDTDVDEALRYIELTNLRTEEIYRQYYDSNDALMIVPYGLHSHASSESDGFIYCNANAADYIDRLFGEYRDEMNADVCIFVPDNVSEDDPAILRAEGLGIPDYAGDSWKPDIKIIHYQGRKTGFYLSSSEDSLLTFVENPVVAYIMRTPAETGVPVMDTHKASASGNIAFRADTAMLRELQARNDIRCEVIPISETVQREFDSVKRICGALALICVVFVALDLFVSGFLIRMEYRLRAKEYCIKTVLGYTMLQKFGSFLTMSALSVLVSIVLVILLRNQLHVNPVVLAVICGGMLIADTVTIFVYAVRIERSSIVSCLKGGAL